MKKFRKLTLRVGRGLIKEVGVGVFDAVIIGELGAIGMRIVEGGEIGRAQGTAPTKP